jgi:transcriptional regulator with XRE-family HTH domain
MTEPETFGGRLSRIRDERKLTRMALAETVGVVRSTITKWEYENSLPNSDHIEKLCRALRVSPNTLLGMADDVVPESAHDRVRRVLEAEGWKKASKILRLPPKVVDALLDGRLQLSNDSMQKVADAYRVSIEWLKSGNPSKWDPDLATGISVRLRFFRISLGKKSDKDFIDPVETSEVYAVEERDSGRLRPMLAGLFASGGANGRETLLPRDLDWILTGTLSTTETTTTTTSQGNEQ